MVVSVSLPSIFMHFLIIISLEIGKLKIWVIIGLWHDKKKAKKTNKSRDKKTVLSKDRKRVEREQEECSMIRDESSTLFFA